jgi:hypothetical protein
MPSDAFNISPGTCSVCAYVDPVCVNPANIPTVYICKECVRAFAYAIAKYFQLNDFHSPYSQAEVLGEHGGRGTQ